MPLDPRSCCDEARVSDGGVSMSGSCEWVRHMQSRSLNRWTCEHAFLLPSHAGSFRWSNSNASSSLLAPGLIHLLLSSQEGGRTAATASLENVRVWGCGGVCVCGGGHCGWLINQTASTQPPNTLTRQGIYIPLPTCQEIAQQWIITERVLWRGEHAGGDRDSWERKGCSREHHSALRPPIINEDK